jgi:hypothetical protein
LYSIDRNPITAPDEDSFIVDLEKEGSALLTFEEILNELDSAESDISSEGIDY